MLTAKEDIRKELLQRRVKLPSDIKQEYDLSIINNLKTLPEYSSATEVMLYCSIKGEPDLSPLFEELAEEGKNLVLPRVKGSELELVRVGAPLCLTDGTFNIPEPASGEIISPEELELVVVPGVAFDRQGYRVGFGKGYYDRLLERVRAPKIGVAYSFQVLDSVPRDSWDRPVDILVTEKEVIRR
ncbi:5-formyltetrahydrofolate cyclo-ligase [Hydrogenivirga sp.]